jgi:hypothetical protein
MSLTTRVTRLFAEVVTTVLLSFSGRIAIVGMTILKTGAARYLRNKLDKHAGYGYREIGLSLPVSRMRRKLPKTAKLQPETTYFQAISNRIGRRE